MRKWIAVILALVIVLCSAGCKKSAPEGEENGNANGSISSSENNSQNNKKPSADDKSPIKNGVSGDTWQGGGSDNGGSQSGGAGNGGSQVGGSDKGSVATVTKETVKINSLDKLNFYAVKKAIAEGGITALSAQSQSGRVTNLSGGNYRLLNLANSTATSINANSAFTITMYSYFTVTLSDASGFLAQKLGSTGSVEVVITKNNFNNMITFKKGERYYSCFEVSSNENAISFSTHKYVSGFKLVENYDQENYQFTIYFDGDRVIGINSGRYYSEKTSYKYKPDNIALKDKFSFVIFKKQSFTAEQLEKLFSNNNSFVDDGVVLADGTILFGESSVTNIPVYFKNTSNKTVLTNSDIKKISPMHNSKYGFCIKLDLKDSGKISGKVNLNFYLDKTKVMQMTLQKDGSAVYATGFTSKSKMSDIFYKLTALDAGNTIGKFLDREEFEREISKKVNLDDYSVEIRDYSDYYNSGYNATHVYTLKGDKNLSYTPTNYEVTIDGITITMPIKVSDLIAKGFKVKSKNFDSPTLSSSIDFETPKGNIFTTYAMNFYRNSTNFYDTYVTQISCYLYEDLYEFGDGIRYTAPEMDMLYGINKNSTLDDIISRLGVPNKMYIYFSENTKANYKTTHATLYFNFATPSLPNGYFICNIFPTKSSGVPSDYLEHYGMTLQ